MSRERLDLMLERAGLAPSRARARDAILRGTVRVNGVPAGKPGQRVGPEDVLSLEDPAAAYVSRAALKLLAGLDAGGIDPQGLVCLDLGTSTGGFTQLLAGRGAKKIYAVDVGHGQLHPRVASLPAVVSLEGTDARRLDRPLVPEPVDLLVCDVSFVSLLKILDAPLSLCAPDARAVLLVKPQFEVGRDHVGKNGIVRPGPHVEAAVDAVVAKMAEEGWRLAARIASPLTGGDGNQEYVTVFRRGG